MKHDQHRSSERSNQDLAPSLADFDADAYRPYLDGLELEDDQANALLRIIWDMMRMCIEMNVPAENWGQIVDAVIDGSADEFRDVD